jgi:hypothetical protein
VVEEDGMCLSGVASPEDNEIRLLDFTVGGRPAACSKNRRQTGDAGGVSGSVTAVDVVATDRSPDELLRGVVDLIGGLGAAEHPERRWAMPLNSAANASGRTV